MNPLPSPGRDTIYCVIISVDLATKTWEKMDTSLVSDKIRLLKTSYPRNPSNPQSSIHYWFQKNRWHISPVLTGCPSRQTCPHPLVHAATDHQFFSKLCKYYNLEGKTFYFIVYLQTLCIGKARIRKKRNFASKKCIQKCLRIYETSFTELSNSDDPPVSPSRVENQLRLSHLSWPTLYSLSVPTFIWNCCCI